MIFLRPVCAKHRVLHHGEQRTRGRNSSQENSQTKDEGRYDTNKGAMDIWKGEEGDWWADGEGANVI